MVGVEPAGADDAARSLRAGHIIPSTDPRTIADGLRSSLGERPFGEIRRSVDDIVTVPEEAIVAAMRRLWEVLKIVVEPSGAVPYAALVAPGDGAAGDGGAGIAALRGTKIGIVLSGGNVDLERLPWCATKD